MAARIPNPPGLHLFFKTVSTAQAICHCEHVKQTGRIHKLQKLLATSFLNVDTPPLKMEAVYASEMFVTLYQTAQFCNPGYHNRDKIITRQMTLVTIYTTFF
jgi:hypothetical protein